VYANRHSWSYKTSQDPYLSLDASELSPHTRSIVVALAGDGVYASSISIHELQVQTSVYQLPGVINRARLAHHDHLDLTRIVKALLDFMRDIAGKTTCRVFVNFLGFDDNTHFSPCLNSE
jgi:hypothetical protein